MSKLAEIQKEWESSHRYGDRNSRLERANRWLPYYAFLASSASIDVEPARFLRNEFIDRLIAEKKLFPGDRVLDIGAGTGNYTLPLAAAAQEVTALDVSEESLSVLMKRAEKAEMKNITLVRKPWEEFSPDHLFDLSFSAMCTAICSTEELERMEKMTKRTCAIVTVMPGSADSHRKAILNGLKVHPDGMIGDALTFYQVLYYLNRYPEVACKTVRYSTEISEERFIEQYQSYLPIFGVKESEYLPYLESYWRDHAENGCLTEESELHLAMITWNVPCRK